MCTGQFESYRSKAKTIDNDNLPQFSPHKIQFYLFFLPISWFSPFIYFFRIHSVYWWVNFHISLSLTHPSFSLVGYFWIAITRIRISQWIRKQTTKIALLLAFPFTELDSIDEMQRIYIASLRLLGSFIEKLLSYQSSSLSIPIQWKTTTKKTENESKKIKKKKNYMKTIR